MRIRKIFCILLALAMLLVSMTPLAARNKPYQAYPDAPISHPWQDDNQDAPDDPQTRVTVNIGGIIIGFDLPSFLVPTGLKPKSSTIDRGRKTDSGTDIISAKRTYRGIRTTVTTKGY